MGAARRPSEVAMSATPPPEPARVDAAAHGCGPRRLRRRARVGALGAIAGALLFGWTGGMTTRAAADPAAGAPPEPQIGQPAPDFKALGSDGATHRLADYHGKVVVLEWTNADCPYTRKHYESGNMQAMQRLARDHGVVWLSVVSSAPGTQGFVTAPEANE